ncbi:hypothetical protein AVEN_73283-1 [Araneus ventricosus]|uniref:Uncharacterized protein n=1 Tax=Araneus ventricosus TaxID=182803 RepID=A0A4Y2KJL8_ARAVE|nr:hypothetical protein AVEN_73283-1 [Araneus ventricosus]
MIAPSRWAPTLPQPPHPPPQIPRDSGFSLFSEECREGGNERHRKKKCQPPGWMTGKGFRFRTPLPPVGLPIRVIFHENVSPLPVHRFQQMVSHHFFDRLTYAHGA